jgi:cytochrome b561
MTTSHRRGQTLWKLIVFLVGFVILLAIVSRMFLLPAMQAATDGATPGEQKQLSAYAWLLMTILLVILFAGLVLTFKAGRYFIGKPSPRVTTQYSDAWTESAKRMKTPPAEPDDE